MSHEVHLAIIILASMACGYAMCFAANGAYINYVVMHHASFLELLQYVRP